MSRRKIHKDKAGPESAPRKIEQSEQLKLWAASAGRCAFCNAKVTEHEHTTMPIPIGEMGHNVGRAKSERSPRGLDDDLPTAERNLAANLLLLCPDDHALIDKKLAAGEFTIEWLRELKHTFEERISYVTGLTENEETVVVRVIGEIRGTRPEVSRETVRLAVRLAGKYPRYKLGARDDSDLEVNLGAFPGEGTTAYWEAIETRLRQLLVTQLGAVAEAGDAKHLSVFAFGRIPALVLTGHLLDDKIGADIYGFHRDTGSWAWPSDHEPTSFRFEQITTGSDPSRVVLVCALTGTHVLSNLPAALADSNVYVLQPTNRDASWRLIRSAQCQTNFASTYREFLAQVESAHPDAASIDVLPAVSLTVAVELGRARMRDVHPRLRIWDRDGDTYAFALEIGP